MDEYDEDYRSQDEEFHASRPRRSETLTTRVTRIALIALSSAVVVLMLVVGLIRPPIQPAQAPGVTYVSQVKEQAVPLPWTRIRTDISKGLVDARTVAENRARVEVALWVKELRRRAEQEFMPRFLGYGHQNTIALKSCFQSLRHMIDPAQPQATKTMRSEAAEMFRQMVLRPPLAQAQVERIARETIGVFADEAAQHIESIPSSYRVPMPEWETYIAGAARLLQGPGGTRSLPIVIKAAAVSSMAVTMVIAGPTIEVSRMVLSKLFGRTAGRQVVVTGSKAAGLTLGRLAGPAALLIAGWDILDHHMSKRRLQPILQQSIDEYMTQIEDAVVNEILMSVDLVRHEIVTALPRTTETNKKKEEKHADKTEESD